MDAVLELMVANRVRGEECKPLMEEMSENRETTGSPSTDGTQLLNPSLVGDGKEKSWQVCLLCKDL